MRSEIRELRQSIALSQEEFARLLDVPLETLPAHLG
jgi:DNA-binding transcriptional regulator YiaG